MEFVPPTQERIVLETLEDGETRSYLAVVDEATGEYDLEADEYTEAVNELIDDGIVQIGIGLTDTGHQKYGTTRNRGFM